MATFGSTAKTATEGSFLGGFSGVSFGPTSMRNLKGDHIVLQGRHRTLESMK